MRTLRYFLLAGVTATVLGGCCDPIRKTYTVGFIVLAPQSTDVASAETQEYLRRVDEVRRRLPNQFLANTSGKGAVNASYPIVVLQPPPPIYENIDDHLMWAFLRRTVREQFYTSHPDIFDFLAVYEIYPNKTIEGRHHTIKPFVGGFGLAVVNDGAAAWGSSGRLRGLGLVEDATTMPADYDWLRSGMWLLLHEVLGHQWGVNPGRIASNGHWLRTIEAPTNSIMYAVPWRKVDDTHFETELVEAAPELGFCHPHPGVIGGICEEMTFHPWLLYVAGMKTRSEVPESLIEVVPNFPIVDDWGDQANSAAEMKRWAKYTNGITGTYNIITLQEIIDVAGDRYDVSGLNQAPVVKIELPQDGSALPHGSAIVFRASALDPEDGSLDPSWSSSLDGPLGTATEFISSTLSVGTHTIKATAIDSQGGFTMHNSDLIRITIAP